MSGQFNAERVTTQEMNIVYDELKEKVGNKLAGFELS